eukprot:UN06441
MFSPKQKMFVKSSSSTREGTASPTIPRKISKPRARTFDTSQEFNDSGVKGAVYE